jgi:VanZ family protein
MKVGAIKPSNRVWFIVSTGYFAFLFLILLLADMGKLPIPLIQRTPYDKVGHFILYGIASYLSHRVLDRRMMALGNSPIPLGPFLFGALTIFEEMLQSILPNRTASLEDLAASLLGIVLFYCGGEIWERQRRS